MTILAIPKFDLALKLWLNAILPILLEKHSLDKSEWDRISSIGDNDKTLEEKLNNKWLDFIENEVKGRQINPHILKLLQKHSE